jgi:hypothetical protein
MGKLEAMQARNKIPEPIDFFRPVLLNKIDDFIIPTFILHPVLNLNF